MALRLLASLWLLVSVLIRKLTFLAVRLVLQVTRAIWWKLSGTQVEIERKKDNACSEGKCAQAFRVISWCKPDVLLPYSLRDFILTHDDFIDPAYVIDNDHVSLFFLDPHEDVAVFGEGPDGTLLWESKHSPFISISLFNMSKRLIVMPMDTFHEVCGRLPDPQGRLVIMGNVARCGSTLLTQVFECSKKVITYSEPTSFRDLALLYRRKGHCQEVMKLTRSLVRIHCRPLKSFKDPEGYLIKPSGPSMMCMECVKAVYPNTVFFYMYRDMTKVSESIYKLSFVLASMRLMYLLARVSGSMLQKVLSNAGYHTEGYNKSVRDDFSCGVVLAVYSSTVYSQLKKQGVNIHAISFDKFMKNKENGVKTIFKLCGLSMDFVKDAMEAFSRDSQKDSILSREVFAGIPALSHTEEDRVRASQVLVEFGYPPVDQPTTLQGTLNFSDKAMHI